MFCRSKYYRWLAPQVAEDEQELAQMVSSKKQFLGKGVENYLKCLKCDVRYLQLKFDAAYVGIVRLF